MSDVQCLATVCILYLDGSTYVGKPNGIFPVSGGHFFQEDVRRLGQMHFLRLNGARNIGIRTSFGVPVVSRWGVTFVIVFYSRQAVQVRVWSYF